MCWSMISRRMISASTWNQRAQKALITLGEGRGEGYPHGGFLDSKEVCNIIRPRNRPCWNSIRTAVHLPQKQASEYQSSHCSEAPLSPCKLDRAKEEHAADVVRAHQQ